MNIKAEELGKLKALRKEHYQHQLRMQLVEADIVSLMNQLALDYDLPPGKYVDEETGEIKDAPRQGLGG